MCAWNANKLVVKCLFRFGIWCADNLRSGQIDKHYHWKKDLQFVCWYFVTGLVLTSSISGRNACLSEEVTLTCTAQGIVVFWGNEAFGELTMHYTSAPPGENSEQKLWTMIEAEIAWFPLWAFVQLPHTMEPQLCAQIETEVPVNHFHCTLCQVSGI